MKKKSINYTNCLCFFDDFVLADGRRAAVLSSRARHESGVFGDERHVAELGELLLGL